MAIWKLTIEDDEGQKTVVPLVRDEYTLGRREGHTIRLTERNISRDHARLKKEDDAYAIEDLGSYNGVFVNGHRVAEPLKLQHGDLLLIGDYRIEAHNEDAAGARAIPLVSSAPAPVSAKPSSVPPPTVAAKPVREVKPHRLVLLTGDEGGAEFPLDKSPMTIGRGEEVDVRVNHSSVSRTHCELSTQDGDHYEVVDSGSANGIRVNGQDVKKALLSSGDTLELGDVVLKYVAKGQPFVFDAAAAAAARELTARAVEPKKTSPVVLGLVALGVIGAVVGGAMLARSGKDDVGTAPSASASAPAADALAKPYKLKQDGEFDAAHEGVVGLSEDSPLRKDKRFVEIENAWADKAIADARKEPDADKKRASLNAVLKSGADESFRSTARVLLGELDVVDAPAPKPTGKPVAPVPTPPPTATAPVAPEPKPTAPAIKPTAPPTGTTAVVKPPAPPAPPAGCASYKGDYTGAMRAKDYECVRGMLLPRLNQGSISQPEARYLKAACQALGDNACQKRAAEKL